MVRFDDLRWTAHRARFDDVGIERSLDQPLDAASCFFVFLKYAACFPVEDGNELFADDLPLLLRIGYPREFLHEALGGIDCDQAQAEIVTQILLNFLKLVLAQHSIVDEDARQARFSRRIAHGAIHQHRRDGRIDPARKRTDRASLSDLLFHLRHGRVDKMLRCPGRLRSTNVQREVAQDVPAKRRVVHLGMKLHRPHLPRRVFDGRDSVRSFRGQPEPRRQFFGRVAVRHPDREQLGQSLKKLRVGFLDLHLGMAVLAFRGGAHLAAKRIDHELQSVADAEHGDAQFEDALVGVRPRE